MRLLPSLSVLLALVALSSALPAQQMVGGEWETLWQFNGLTPRDHLGSSVSDAGDVDGDGYADVIVGAYAADPNGYPAAGSAYVYSGLTGNLLLQFDGVVGGDYLGCSVSGAGDVDGDGFADLIVGAYGANGGNFIDNGSAFVYSGATGSLLWRFDGAADDDRLGYSVSGASDVDGDGVPDLIVGAYLADAGGILDAGSAYVYSGSTGNLIWQFDGSGAEDWLGFAVAGAGDVNSDGFADLIVGAMGADPNGLLNAGSAYVYSGATGNVIWQYDGWESYGWMGTGVASAGDIDGDGVPDLIVGSGITPPNGRLFAGSALVYSGATGDLIWWFGGNWMSSAFGGSVDGAGDVDGDGVPDLIVGSAWAKPNALLGAGAAYFYSGATGQLFRRFDGTAPEEGMGRSVSGAGDVNGDGFPDLIVGAWRTDYAGYRSGSAYVFCLDPFLHSDSRELSATAGTQVQLALDFPATEAGYAYAVLASGAGIGPTTQGGLDIPLTPDPAFNRMLGGWNPPILQGGRGTLDPNGDAQATLYGHPALAPAIGRTVYLAAASYDSATMTGRLSSIARYLTIVP